MLPAYAIQSAEDEALVMEIAAMLVKHGVADAVAPPLAVNVIVRVRREWVERAQPTDKP